MEKLINKVHTDAQQVHCHCLNTSSDRSYSCGIKKKSAVAVVRICVAYGEQIKMFTEVVYVE